MDLVTLAVANALGGNGGGGSSLPTNPAQDGTYNLQNTVSSGTSTLSWASGGSSGGGVLVVNVTEPEADLHVCDKTAGDMLAACKTGIVVFVETYEGEENVMVCTSANFSGGEYSFKPGVANYSYVASSSAGYPTYDDR